MVKYQEFVPQGFSLELEFFTKVLHMKSLHYGYWEGIEGLTFENLYEAQKKYTEKIISLLPVGKLKILDVGAGIGDNAIALAKLGHQVTSLSPEPGQKLVFDTIVKDFENIKFVHTKFEDFKSEEMYDFILMSESSNYFPKEEGLEQVKKYLKDKGFLLLAGMFRKTSEKMFEEMHNYDEYVSEAKSLGINVVKDEDVTKSVLPTLDLAYQFYDYYGKPAIEVFSEFYRRAFTFKAKLLSIFFKTEIGMIKELVEDLLPRRLDPRVFEKHVTYRFVLFQKK